MALFSHPFTPPGAPVAPGGEIERMNQILVGDMALQIARTAATYGLADHAAAGPIDPAGFATAAGLDPPVTLRFLRAAVTIGLLVPGEGGLFHGTPLLDTLRSDRPDTLRDLAMMFGDEEFVLPGERLPTVLRTGHDHCVEVLGEPLFDWFGRHPDRAGTFMRGMAAFTVGVAERVAELLPLDGARTVVDVGGGDGGLVRAFLLAHPGVRGIVLDLPHIVGAAAEGAAADGVGDRLDAVGGDFFTAVPAGDICLLKHIVHDWDDEHALTILRHCREAVGPDGRVVLLEQMVGASDSGLEAIFDMWMLTIVTGRERTREEFEELLRRAGLTLRAVVPTGTANQLIEAVPARVQSSGPEPV